MTKHAVRFQHALRTRLHADDSGQGALEYVGILIVVAAMVALILAAFDGVGANAAGKIATAVTDFLG